MHTIDIETCYYFVFFFFFLWTLQFTLLLENPFNGDDKIAVLVMFFFYYNIRYTFVPSFIFLHYGLLCLQMWFFTPRLDTNKRGESLVKEKNLIANDACWKVEIHIFKSYKRSSSDLFSWIRTHKFKRIGTIPHGKHLQAMCFLWRTILCIFFCSTISKLLKSHSNCWN